VFHKLFVRAVSWPKQNTNASAKVFAVYLFLFELFVVSVAFL